MPEQIMSWKTADGKLFASYSDARRHEATVTFSMWYEGKQEPFVPSKNALFMDGYDAFGKQVVYTVPVNEIIDWLLRNEETRKEVRCFLDCWVNDPTCRVKDE